MEGNDIPISLPNEPVREISNNVVCVTNKASDQPAHTRSLIRAFASRLNIKLLTERNLEVLSLTGGSTGSSECTLVKTPHCWKAHVTAQMVLVTEAKSILRIGAWTDQENSHGGPNNVVSHQRI